MAMDGASSVPIEKAVAIPTFIGSLASFLATSTAIVFHIMYPPTRHFRHALIINLLVAGKPPSVHMRWMGIWH